ncbi:MAG: hypothetical protein ACTTKN_01980 [Phocaeicola sp.]
MQKKVIMTVMMGLMLFNTGCAQKNKNQNAMNNEQIKKKRK